MTGKSKSLLQQKQTPLVYHFNALAKGYFGRLTNALSDVQLERYYFVLTLVTQYKSISQQSLADCLDIDKANMVRMIDYLSDMGYVKRKSNPGDRREHIIIPTAKAIKLVPKIEKGFQKVNAETVKGMSKTEIKLFYMLLEKACHNLSDLPSEKYFLKYIKTK